MSVHLFKNKKKSQQKITMVTCYDAWSAKILNESPLDALLVGDSLAMVVYGHATTLNATVDLMTTHIRAVAKGAPNKFIIGDMPFMSYRKDFASGVQAATELMQAGAAAVKLEGAAGNEKLVSHLVESGIPVMGHLGLTPQSVHQLGGFKVQARQDEEAERLLKDAKTLQECGAFAVVLECVPATVARKITAELNIPTIGIGAGRFCDGQVLVLQDMLGMNKEFKPKFLRTYLNGWSALSEAILAYHKDVESGQFPSDEESYLC